MQRFLSKLLIFSGLFLSTCLIALWFSKTLFNQAATFQLDEECSRIIVGHSHPQCAYNDTLIQNTQNLAISGEAYFYTYFKLKKIVEDNPQVKVVFIEFTNNQLSESINEWMWGDKYLSYHFMLHSAYINYTDKFLLFRHNPQGYIVNLPNVFKDQLKRGLQLKFDAIPSFGGFKGLVGDLAEYRAKMTDKTSVDEDFVIINDKVSNLQIEYLLKIIDLLDKQGIQVCLIRSPQHPSYAGLSNEERYQQTLSSYFSNVLFIDLINFPLSDTQFRDPEHLNTEGAALVSIWLNDFLQLEDSIALDKKHWTYNELINLINKDYGNYR